MKSRRSFVLGMGVAAAASRELRAQRGHFAGRCARSRCLAAKPIYGSNNWHYAYRRNVGPVEAQFRVKKDRTSRAIAGRSMGGSQSMAIGLNNLATFSAVGAFSPALVGGNFEAVVPDFMASPEKANRELRLLWLGCGDIDSMLDGNQNFEAALGAKIIRHEWTLTPGYAHWWTLRRVYLREFLTKAFPPERLQP